MDDEDAVFRAPPKQFTAVRDARAAALKAAGRGDEAKATKALRRPPVVVWLWNRLFLDGDAAAREAMAAIRQLARAIAGEKSEEVAQAAGGLRAAGQALLSRARALTAELDVGFPVELERELTELVQALPWSAASLDEAELGRLRAMPPPVDPLAAMRLLAGAPARPRPAAVEKSPDRDHAQAERDRARREAEAALAAAESALAKAAAAHATAARERERSQAALERARAQFQESAEKADAAERAEAAARRAVEKARARLSG